MVIAGPGRVWSQRQLAPLTSFGIGGPAEWLVEPTGLDSIRRLVECVRDAAAPMTVIGGGSNLLVADEGVSGIVVRLSQGGCERIARDLVRADAGLSINGLVRWCVRHGIAGLEHWAGTPGCVGGAVWGNAHFRGRTIDERVVAVKLLSREGQLVDVRRDELEFAYDASRLQRTGEMLLSADFRVSDGVPAQLRARARDSLLFRKRTQPLALRSAGCIFRNPDPTTVPAGFPASAGALVDRAGMKGCSIGGARVSQVHANFIVNEGGARATEVAILIEACRSAVLDQFGITLEEEIVRVGEF